MVGLTSGLLLVDGFNGCFFTSFFLKEKNAVMADGNEMSIYSQILVSQFFFLDFSRPISQHSTLFLSFKTLLPINIPIHLPQYSPNLLVSPTPSLPLVPKFPPDAASRDSTTAATGSHLSYLDHWFRRFQRRGRLAGSIRRDARWCWSVGIGARRVGGRILRRRW